MTVGRLRALVPPLVAGALFLGAWEGGVRGFGISKFLLPKPTSIWAQLIDQWPTLLLAFLTTRFRTVNEGLTPLAVAVNATPIVALAPIFNAWFGITGTLSNQAVVVAVVFFPVFINTAKGLTEVHPDEIELMRSYAAGEWMILREVRIPNALPFFANALRLVAPLSVIAAIVGDGESATKP